MNGVTAIANVLKLEGVDFIACMPSNPLIEAAAIAGIRPIVCRQERTGVHMADGFARITNGKKLGIFLMQAGPGAENAMGGVAQAYADSVPILLLPAGASRRRLGTAPVFSPTRSYESITKWSAQINFADRVPELMRRAMTKLRSGKPGPVLLEIPQDVATEEIKEEAFDYQPPQFVRTAADPEAVRRAVRAMLQAQRPVIQAGQGVLYGEATPELLEVAEFLQAPVYTTLSGKSAFPENHPLALGTAAGSTTGMVHQFLTRADLVFGIGTSFTKANTAAPILPGKTLIHATNEADDINKDYASQHALVGDAKLVLTQVLEELKRQGRPKSRAEAQAVQGDIRRVKEQWLAQWMPKLTSDETPINPYRVIWDLMHTVDLDNVIVTHDSGSSREEVSPFWEARAPRSFIGWGKSTQLGYSLGLAMGAKLAAPEKLVINIMGDAAFGMVGLDVETAVRSKIPILTIILNNSTMAIYPDSRVPTAQSKFRLKELSGNFAEVAQALGAYSEKVTQPRELVPAFQRAIAATQRGEPALLEVITVEEGAQSKFQWR
ncbi:MAG: thiamine pyrophosphate-requiring protein [SAR202 cluster bacterium]|nr:thiamine pyrophosphate-requiring protein [SAR202 cluster bacterium]